MTNQNKRVILVTGASRGVGKGIAEGMARKEDIIICACLLYTSPSPRD